MVISVIHVNNMTCTVNMHENEKHHKIKCHGLNKETTATWLLLQILAVWGGELRSLFLIFICQASEDSYRGGGIWIMQGTTRSQDIQRQKRHTCHFCEYMIIATLIPRERWGQLSAFSILDHSTTMWQNCWRRKWVCHWLCLVKNKTMQAPICAFRLCNKFWMTYKNPLW